ncbi:hypothetical protein RMN56_05370 [Micromonospora halotolerans]|uniref:Transposase n=1 Tax=Micromonospora halotolerans TaxID=709879 RepID=A0ABZ0A067_9ACTN|nr:hypothetical protein [Micromonospora halotolerans]WNM40778.1 hypothetical protein RMN56_05370 [Micromonospora halotolerans]
MPRYKYSPERLAAAAAQARSVTEVMRLLGVRVSGGSHAHISRQLKRFGIDTSHFTGSAHNKGQRGVRRTTSSQLLVRLPAGSRRTPGSRLKWALDDIGVPEECEVVPGRSGLARPAADPPRRPPQRRLPRQPAAQPQDPLSELPQPDRHLRRPQQERRPAPSATTT